MKKRIVSLLLAGMILLSCWPGSARAKQVYAAEKYPGSITASITLRGTGNKNETGERSGFSAYVSSWSLTGSDIPGDDLSSYVKRDGDISAAGAAYPYCYCVSGHGYMNPLAQNRTVTWENVTLTKISQDNSGAVYQEQDLSCPDKPFSAGYQQIGVCVKLYRPERPEKGYIRFQKLMNGSAPGENPESANGIWFYIYGYNTGAGRYEYLDCVSTHAETGANGVRYNGVLNYQIPDDKLKTCGNAWYYIREMGIWSEGTTGRGYYADPLEGEHALTAEQGKTWQYGDVILADAENWLNTQDWDSRTEADWERSYHIRCASGAHYHTAGVVGSPEGWSPVYDNYSGKQCCGVYAALNDARNLYLAIHKVDADDRKTGVRGVSFDLYGSSGRHLGRVTTDNDGYAVFSVSASEREDFPIRAYEVDAPAEYREIPGNLYKPEDGTGTVLTFYCSDTRNDTWHTREEAILHAVEKDQTQGSYIRIRKTDGNQSDEIRFDEMKFLFSDDRGKAVEPAEVLHAKGSRVWKYRFNLKAGTGLFLQEDTEAAKKAGFDTDIIPVVKGKKADGKDFDGRFDIYRQKFPFRTKNFMETGNFQTTDNGTDVDLELTDYQPVFFSIKKTGNDAFSQDKGLIKGNPNYDLAGTVLALGKGPYREETDYSVENPAVLGWITLDSLGEIRSFLPSVYAGKALRKGLQAGKCLEMTDYLSDDSDGRFTLVEMTKDPEIDGTHISTSRGYLTAPGKESAFSHFYTEFTMEPGNVRNRVQEVRMENMPAAFPAKLDITKKDALLDSQESPAGSTLAGAEFRVVFYPFDINTDFTVEQLLKSQNPAGRTWYFRTIREEFADGETTLSLDSRHFEAVNTKGEKSDAPFLLRDSSGRILKNDTCWHMPLGWLTVEEVTPPEGYTLEGYEILDRDGNICAVKNDQAPSGAVCGVAGDFSGPSGKKLLRVDGKYTDALIVRENEIRGDICLWKKDGEMISAEGEEAPMAHVKYRIRNTLTGETHYAFTDDNGFLTTRAGEKQTWNGKEITTSHQESKDYKINYYDTREDYDGTISGVWFTGTTERTAASDRKYGESVNRQGSLPYGTYGEGDRIGRFYEIKEMPCKANGYTESRQNETFYYTDITEDPCSYINIFDHEAGVNQSGSTADPERKAQYNVRQPEIRTRAYSAETGSGTMVQGAGQTIVDEVSYFRLRADTTYTLKTELMYRDREGNVYPYPVSAMGEEADKVPLVKKYAAEDRYVLSHTFRTGTAYSRTRYEMTGMTTVLLPGINTCGYEGGSFVVYQTLCLGDTIDQDRQYGELNQNGVTGEKEVFPIVHADAENTAETVFPADIHTNLTDAVTGTHIGFPEGNVTLCDKVSYTGLTAGETYRIKGRLYIRENGRDDSGEAETQSGMEPSEVENAEVTFTPETPDGTVVLSFTVNGADLAGKTAVAAETLYYGDVEMAVHEDPGDEDETVYFPSVGTEVKNNETGTDEALALGTVTLTDTINYKNLVAGHTYTAEAVLVDASSGTPLFDADGKKITGSTVFEIPEVSDTKENLPPDAEDKYANAGYAGYAPGEELLDMSGDHGVKRADGSVEVELSFQADHFAGIDAVVFEEVKLKLSGASGDDFWPVSQEKNIHNAAQTVHFPEIGTVVTAEDTQGHETAADAEFIFRDTVQYSNLRKDGNYHLKGKLMDGETGEPLLIAGKEVTAEKDFVPASQGTGTEELFFHGNGTSLAGRKIVVFENLYRDGKRVALHENLRDHNQTIYVPEIHTEVRAADTKTHTAFPKKETRLVDTVSYKNLVAGTAYVVKGVLADPETGKELLINGKKVTGETEICPGEITEEDKACSGSVEVTFVFDATALSGKSVVVYEEIYKKEDLKRGAEPIAVHRDKKDLRQQIAFPVISTTALGKDTGAHFVCASEKTCITDAVRCGNLTAGESYRITGTLMCRETGEPVKDAEGHTVTAEKVFTSGGGSEQVNLEFIFDASGLSGRHAVVFEVITPENSTVSVAEHKDLTSEDQTVEIREPQVKGEERLPENADQPSGKPPKTGDILMFLITVALAAAGVSCILAGYIRKKSKGEKQREKDGTQP